MLTVPMLGIYKGGEISGGGAVTGMVNIIAAHHTRNIDGANWLLARGCDYHHRLNWNLDLELGEAAVLLPELATLGFTIGVQPVDEPTAHYVTEAPKYSALIRQEPFVNVTAPHDIYAGAEVHDYTDAELRTYIINKGGQRTRLYYGRHINLTTALKGAADWGTEPPHIVHIALNATTTYNTVTPEDIAISTREFFEWWTPQNRTDLIYAHFNTYSGAVLAEVRDLMLASITAAAQSSEYGLDCIMVRVHDPATGGSLDCHQACIDAITEVRAVIE